MVKERYKDDSLDIADAGEKVKALINEHLIDLGINPKIPPIELLSPDFMDTSGEAFGWRSGGEGERDGARAPQALHGSFRRRSRVLQALSDKLESSSGARENWEALAQGYEPCGGRPRRVAPIP
jgi:type I restriction enzyme R subunit